jgi:hypothetical protein
MSTIKTTVYIFTFIFTSSFYGQKKITIYLEEIKVFNKPRGKIIDIKTKGTTSSLSGQIIKSTISRVDDLPSGKLSSIKFYFNRSLFTILEGKYGVNYKDVELGLLIYDVNEDGTPSETITDKEIRFLVTSDHRGSIELDLRPLNLYAKNSLYFGFELFKEQTAIDFQIMIKSSKKNSKTFYMKNWKNDKIVVFSDGMENFAIKMVVAVLQQK